MIEVLLWIYGVGVIVTLIIVGFINFQDGEVSAEGAMLGVLTGLLWFLFVVGFIGGLVYSIGAGASVLKDKMFGDK